MWLFSSTLRRGIRMCQMLPNVAISTTNEAVKAGVTVDAEDVKHHGSMADKWWNSNSPVKLLQQLNPIRLQLICEGLGMNQESGSLKGLKVLDAACGGGFLSEALSLLGAEVTGVDASKNLIDIAKHHAEQNPKLMGNLPRYIHSTIEDHALEEPEKYDVVVASEILEHVLDPDLFLRSCIQALRPDGHLFITTPNRTLATWLYTIGFLEYTMSIIPRGTHHYKYFVAPETTRDILDKYNCTVINVRNFNYSYIKSEWCWGTKMWYTMQSQKKK